MDADKRFILSMVIVLTVLISGVVGYSFFEDVSLRQAMYMTVITVSTVGFGDDMVKTASGQMFTIVLITLGVGSSSYAMVSLVTLLLGGELRAVMEKSKMMKRIDSFRDHVIICGFGRMGSMVASQFYDQDRTFVVIDLDSDTIKQVQALGFAHVEGDASLEPTLEAAGIHNAAALVAVLPHDADNVYVTLTARGLKSDLQIISRAERTTTEQKLMRAGANHVICPQIIGAFRICGLITRPHVVDFVDVAARGIEFEIDEYIVTENSSLAGKTLRDADLPTRVNAIVVAIKRTSGNVFNPNADERIEIGDTLILICEIAAKHRIAEL